MTFNDFDKEVKASHEQKKANPVVGEALDKEIRKDKPTQHRVERGDVNMRPAQSGIQARANNVAASS